MAALVSATMAQNADTGRRAPLPWEKPSAKASAAMPAVPKDTVPATAQIRNDSGSRTNVLVQKKIRVSDLDRFLDMWR
jgi:hypothetical protein